MANVTIKFNNKEYLLSCEDGQEEHLETVANKLSEKFDNLKNSLGSIGESKLLLITSITILDEYIETKKKIDKKIEELKRLTEKFKAPYNIYKLYNGMNRTFNLDTSYINDILVYEYREKKENEINLLNKEQEEIKNQLEKNNYEYEKIIEKATDDIESFLSKVNSDNQLQ